jgi:hypothetical protein
MASTNIFFAVSIHSFGTYLSGWLWVVPLSVAYLLAWTLPFLSQRFARFLSNQLHVQKARLVNNILTFCLCLAGISGVIVGLLNVTGNWLSGSRNPWMLFVGFLNAFLAIGGGQFNSLQLWQKRQVQIHARMSPVK